MDEISAPWPPPTSTSIRGREKSYAATTAASNADVNEVMAAFEDRRAFGVLGIHLEEGVRRARTPHRLPRDYALLELGPRVPVALVAVEDHARAERAGDLVAEERTDLGQREATVRLLGEHAEAHERAQQATKRPASAPVARASSSLPRGPSASLSAMASRAVT